MVREPNPVHYINQRILERQWKKKGIISGRGEVPISVQLRKTGNHQHVLHDGIVMGVFRLHLHITENLTSPQVTNGSLDALK